MTPRSTRVALAAAGLFAGAALAAPAARATPNFPDVVASHLELAAPPDCILCHAGPPGRGTVTTPFGTTLRSRGAQAYDEGALRLALDALAAEKKDSDGDGTSDIDELRSGGDPNGGAGAEAIVPEYGCRASPGRSDDRAGVALVAAVFAIALRRRRAACPR